MALLERADAAELAAAIVKGRNEGFIRAFPILGLVYLSKKDAVLFQATFCKVVLTGNDLVDVNSLTALYGKFDQGLWAAVAARSPVMRFVKYLAKFIREGVLTDELLKAKVNVEALKKAKVFSVPAVHGVPDGHGGVWFGLASVALLRRLMNCVKQRQTYFGIITTTDARLSR